MPSPKKSLRFRVDCCRWAAIVRKTLYGKKFARLEVHRLHRWMDSITAWNIWRKGVPGKVLLEWAYDYVEMHGVTELSDDRADEVLRAKFAQFCRERTDAHPLYGFDWPQRKPGFIKRGVGMNTIRTALADAAFLRGRERWRAADEARKIERRRRAERRAYLKAARDRMRLLRRTMAPVPPEQVAPTVHGKRWTYAEADKGLTKYGEAKKTGKMRRRLGFTGAFHMRKVG